MANRSILSYYDNTQITTVGGSGVDADDTTLTVASNGTYDMHVGQILEIGSEHVTVTAITNATTLTITRETNGTTGAIHSSGATIQNAPVWQDFIIPGYNSSGVYDATKNASAVFYLELSETQGTPKQLQIRLLNNSGNSLSGSSGASQGPYTATLQTFTPVKLRNGDTNEIMFYGVTYDIKENYETGSGMILEIVCYDYLQELRDNTTSGNFGYSVNDEAALENYIAATNIPDDDKLIFTPGSSTIDRASTRAGLIKSLIDITSKNITFTGDATRFTEPLKKFQHTFVYQLGERNKKSVLSHIRELSNSEPTTATGSDFGFDYYVDANLSSTAVDHKPTSFFNYFIRGSRPNGDASTYGLTIAQPYSGFSITGRSIPMTSFDFEKPRSEIYTDIKVDVTMIDAGIAAGTTLEHASRPLKTVDFELLKISDLTNTTLTQLNEALDATEVLIDVDDASSGNTGSQAIIAGMTIRVDSEDMFVTGVSSNTLTVVRGANGTTKAEHSDNTLVKSSVTWGVNNMNYTVGGVKRNILLDSRYAIGANAHITAQGIQSPELIEVKLTQLNGSINSSVTDITVDSTASMYLGQYLFATTSLNGAIREYMKVTDVKSATVVEVTRNVPPPGGSATGTASHSDDNHIWALSVASLQYLSSEETSGGDDITASNPADLMLSSIDPGIVNSSTPDGIFAAGAVVRGHYNRQTYFTILSRPKNTTGVKRTLSISLPSTTKPMIVREEVLAHLRRNTSGVIRGFMATYQKPSFYVETYVATHNPDGDNVNEITLNIDAYDYGLRPGMVLAKVDSNGTQTAYGYVSSVEDTTKKVVVTLNTGTFSGYTGSSNKLRFYVPVRASDLIRVRNDLVNINTDFIVSNVKYIEQPGISYTEYEVETREDSGRSYPVVMPKDMMSVVNDKIATISNTPTTQEIQGHSSGSFPLDSVILGGSSQVNGSLKLTPSSYITTADSQNITFKQFDERTIMEITDAGEVQVKNGATSSGKIQIFEDSDDGTNYVEITVPALAANYTLTLPTTDGNSNEVLTTNGSGTLSWTAVTTHPDPHRIADGGTSAPAYSFSGDTDTGMYRSASNTISFTAGNSDAFSITNAGITLIAGSESAPSLNFSGDTDTGMYRAAGDSLGFTAGGAGHTWTYQNDSGTYRMNMTPLGDLDGTVGDPYFYLGLAADFSAFKSLTAVASYYMYVGAGSVSAPSITFAADSNTGFYSSEADHLDVTTGGSSRMQWNSSGAKLMTYAVGTGTDVVHTSGQLKSKSSSKRYKEDILDLQNIKSEDVYKLRPVSFTWKGNKQEDFGLIAEEVDEVIPKLVHYQDDKPESVAYDKLSVLLLLEITKLKEEIRELKEKV